LRSEGKKVKIFPTSNSQSYMAWLIMCQDSANLGRHENFNSYETLTRNMAVDSYKLRTYIRQFCR